jgi:xanthine dehydrogenase/oxidase
LVEITNYEEKLKEIKKFNNENKLKKRGISIIPNKFAVGFPYRPLNQAIAIVNIYKDSSISIYHHGLF